ncbi:hypothetical protein [Azospirillum griseum]|uniref:hypothetical protein n=1 Tax=Azospirillum griseum TaxID=2496639 RepID=UPI00131582A1|nr:hypothetical protein [Azospirillum griseum]
MEPLRRVVPLKRSRPMMDEFEDTPPVDAQIGLWTRVMCCVLLFGLWLCATSLFLLTEV